MLMAMSLLTALDDPLAQDFDLRAGWVTVTVPDVTPGNDYQITREFRNTYTLCKYQ